MAAGKEQRNNERERAGTSEKVERSRHGGARLPNGLSKVRRGPGLAQRTDGLCHCSRRAVFHRVPSVYVANPGIGVVVTGLALSWGAVKRWETARRVQWHNTSRKRRKPGPLRTCLGHSGASPYHGSAGAMAQPITQTTKAKSLANRFRPFGSLAPPVHARCQGRWLPGLQK